ncbi:TPA: thioredoxin [Candidatus Marinimicrobia bacterium]|nr:MAG: Thioredoxin [Marinimicrobia bacterium 46_47]KUK91662.1 MAG: thioredoxin [Marinimicrobia bacterium 46_43]HAE87934.1 thioredoxin [Candidatus Neomarinimicrobiota bacterium]HBY18725.1 thioredoxin [Candidatus Neomarinimicrobiota bacterium]
MAENVINVNDASFEKDVLKSEVPVLVDFWAEWCMPCRMIAPFLEDIAAEMKGKIIVAKVNVDNSPVTSQKFGIRSIPTLMIFKNGTVADSIIGAVPKNVIRQKIQSIL